MFTIKKSNKKVMGFTLIELLVVVAIIAVLASIVTLNYVNAQKKSRDAKRIADITLTAKAIELYRDQEDAYPSNNCSTTSICYFDGECNNGGICSSLSPLVTGGYISALPHDPKASSTVNADDYWYYDYSATSWAPSLPLGIYLGAKLEITEPNGVIVPYVGSAATASTKCGKDDIHNPTNYCAVLPTL